MRVEPTRMGSVPSGKSPRRAARPLVGFAGSRQAAPQGRGSLTRARPLCTTGGNANGPYCENSFGYSLES